MGKTSLLHDAAVSVRTFFSEVFRRHAEEDAERIFVVGAAETTPDPATLAPECPRPWLYTRVLAFFLATTALLFFAHTMSETIALSNALFVGAFTVPFTVLVLFFELNVFRNISFYTVSKALFLGGVLSIIVTAPIKLISAFSSAGILSASTEEAICAGICEELAKMLVVFWILKRNRACQFILNGLLVGAAVGAGFDIFETVGYCASCLQDGGDAWSGQTAMYVLALRSTLAPGAHVVYAAVSGAALVLAAGREPLTARMLRRKAFLVPFFMMVALHSLWDIDFFSTDGLSMCFHVALVLAAWLVVAWFVRRGLEEVGMLRAAVPDRQEDALTAVEPAGAWRRWTARMVDLTCCGLVAVPPCFLFAFYFTHSADSGTVEVAAILAAATLATLLLEALVYELFGTTLGKWMLSLRVCDGCGRDVPSWTYFKRLLRLWASGCCFFVPFLAPIAFLVQARMLSSRGTTSYDRALGLCVAKGRLRPLRWLALAPLVVGFALADATEDGGDDSDGDGARVVSEEVGQVDDCDENIVKALSAAGLAFRKDEGGAVLDLSVNEGRKQTCHALGMPLNAGGKDCVVFYTFAASRNSIKTEDLWNVLSENMGTSNAQWCRFGEHLALRALVPLDSEPKALFAAVLMLAIRADETEEKLSGKDRF